MINWKPFGFVKKRRYGDVVHVKNKSRFRIGIVLVPEVVLSELKELEKTEIQANAAAEFFGASGGAGILRWTRSA